jgi:peptide/nickel transport system ATP-binding protein
MVQAQILDLLKDLVRDLGVGLLIISHDLSVLSDICDRVAVMYAGRIVEEGPSNRVFDDPAHPYARGLIGALPPLDGSRRRLISIPGTVPDPRDPPPGCAFGPRCLHATGDCTAATPTLETVDAGRRMACVLAVHRRALAPREVAFA